MRDREAWSAAVHGVTKSWIQLSNRTTTILFFNDCVEVLTVKGLT